MKKLLLSATLLASALISTAQNQPEVPNGNFENWSEAECGDIPSQYTTFAELMESETGFCPTASGVTKSTDSHSGTYALKLTAFEFQTIFSQNLVGLGSSTSDGSAFDGRPTKLVGYTKFTKGGSDELLIAVLLEDSEGETVASGELTITSTQAEYAKFEIMLVYEESNTNDPSLLSMGFVLGEDSDDDMVVANENSIALLDDFAFEYETTTSTVKYATASPINVYTANKNINFSENVSDVHIVDMVGAQKMTAADAKTLNAASLTAGMYIVTYKYNNAYFSKKIVIE